MQQRGPEEEFNKQKRLSIIYVIISAIIQIIILVLYYFREKQVALAFPMILGIFITLTAIFPLSQMGRK